MFRLVTKFYLWEDKMVSEGTIKFGDECYSCGLRNEGPSDNTVGTCEGDVFFCSCGAALQVYFEDGKRKVRDAGPAW